MTITFANTNDDYYAVNKNYTPVSTKQNASIVYPCDIHQPTFKIKGGKIDANNVINVFGRNYWITDQVINEGINYISCAVDAYSSFSSDIYGTEQFVNRSEKHYNPELPDNQYPIPARYEIDMYKGNTQITTSFSHVIGVI